MHEGFPQAMASQYTCFDEMQGLYNSCGKHSETLETHHDQTREASRDLK